MSMKEVTRELAYDELVKLKNVSVEPYNIYDSYPTILAALMEHIEGSEPALEDVLRPIIEGAIRDADGRICDPKADNRRHVQIGQLPIFADLDLDQAVPLGGAARLKLGCLRVEHVKTSLRLDTDNHIAVSSAWAAKREWKQGLIDVMELLDPRTTVADIVVDSESA